MMNAILNRTPLLACLVFFIRGNGEMIMIFDFLLALPTGAMPITPAEELITSINHQKNLIEKRISSIPTYAAARKEGEEEEDVCPICLETPDEQQRSSCPRPCRAIFCIDIAST
jgi:hypothetical protein